MTDILRLCTSKIENLYYYITKKKINRTINKIAKEQLKTTSK